MDAPRLLVSVRNVAEASAALRGGADWIDLKEPDRGALGAVDAATARDVVQCVAGRAPISAAAGELADWPTAAARELLTARGLSLLKLGLSACHGLDWKSQLQDAQREFTAADMQLVAVIYADHERAESPRPDEIIAFAAEANCPWVLVDTFDKAGGAVGDHFSPAELRALLQSVRKSGRRTVVAGSLTGATIAALPADLIDMVAVRGAACEGGRGGAVCERRVAGLRDLLTTY
jgi:(5-formylfuran-3-yl)methyl phosphate synthase